MTIRLNRWVPALGLVLVATVTGCNAQDGGAGVASVSGPAATSSTQPSEQEQAVRYAQCLRDKGIEVEDPVDGRPPAIPRGTAPDEEVEAAEEACRQYLPQQVRARQLSAEDLEKLRRMSQCMRDHGYPNFPDPDPDQGGIVLGDDSGIDMKDPKVQQAQRECGMGGPRAEGEQPAPEGTR